MTEIQMLSQILELQAQNKALKRALSSMFDRLELEKSFENRTVWEIQNLDYDRELEAARELIRPQRGKNLQ